MLPFNEIWEKIALIQSFHLPWNMGKEKNKTDLELENFLHLKDEFLIFTMEYVQNIDELINQCSPLIDFTFRYKEDLSIERNWDKSTIPIPLYKQLNDILGMRFVLKMNRTELHSFVQSFIQSCPYGTDKCKIYNLERDGYQGLHVYVRPNNFSFTLEFQFWTRVDALLNQYLRDTIYTKYDNYPEIVMYSNSLREWLDDVPSLPRGHSIRSYVDYLYEKVFQDDDLEESEEHV